MPELRTDRLTGRVVLVAENRAARPNEFDDGTAAWAAGQAPVSAGDCPFCAGNETRTPPAVYQQTGADGGWRVRVVPNMYPAATLDAPPTAVGPALPAFGVHEVIIESARHVERMSALSIAEVRDVLEAYAARLGHWRDDGRFRYGLIFKNEGARAGASIAHVHSQLVALADVPPSVERELASARMQFHEAGACPYCRLIEHERTCGERIVLDCDEYVAFCPFSGVQPMETWLLPRAHEPAFERIGRTDARERLAGALCRLIEKLEAAAPGAAFNLAVRTEPWRPGCERWFHWRIELLPRVTALAGLELAAGVHINPLSPERAAGRLREPPINH
jgi:UDPglucose--hexose-1-phosphate uridylyltransferase